MSDQPKILPCKKCGSANIELSDCGYSSFNPGGGKCLNCGSKVYGEAGCMPDKETLAAIWNAGQTLTAEEELALIDKALYGDRQFIYQPNRVVTIQALKKGKTPREPRERVVPEPDLKMLADAMAERLEATCRSDRLAMGELRGAGLDPSAVTTAITDANESVLRAYRRRYPK